MAQQVVVALVDDLDGSDAVETVTFMLDGARYEIDVSEENAARLRETFAVYVQRGRRTGGRRKRSAGGRQPESGENEAALIRAWAAQEGIGLSDRGRIPGDVKERYRQRDQPKKGKRVVRRR